MILHRKTVVFCEHLSWSGQPHFLQYKEVCKVSKQYKKAQTFKDILWLTAGNSYSNHSNMTKGSLPESWSPCVEQSCSISIFPYRFNINYSVCLLINTNININYFQEGLSISILYQLLKKLPYQFQYQYILSISPYDIVKITNFLSISHCYQYQCWYQLSK